MCDNKAERVLFLQSCPVGVTVKMQRFCSWLRKIFTCPTKDIPASLEHQPSGDLEPVTFSRSEAKRKRRASRVRKMRNSSDGGGSSSSGTVRDPSSFGSATFCDDGCSSSARSNALSMPNVSSLGKQQHQGTPYRVEEHGTYHQSTTSLYQCSRRVDNVWISSGSLIDTEDWAPDDDQDQRLQVSGWGHRRFWIVKQLRLLLLDFLQLLLGFMLCAVLCCPRNFQVLYLML